MLIGARAALGLPAGGNSDHRYTLWRDDVTSYMKNNDIINRKQAGDTYELRTCTLVYH